MPADGLAIKTSQLVVGESAITGEANEKYKNTIEKMGRYLSKDLTAPSPVVISGTRVLKGEGTMLVTVVGTESTQGRLHEMIQG